MSAAEEYSNGFSKVPPPPPKPHLESTSHPIEDTHHVILEPETTGFKSPPHFQVRTEPANIHLEPTNTRLDPANARLVSANTGLDPANTNLGPANTGLESATTFLESANTNLGPTNTGLESATTFLESANTNLGPANTGLESANTRLELTSTSLVHTTRSETDTGQPPFRSDSLSGVSTSDGLGLIDLMISFLIDSFSGHFKRRRRNALRRFEWFFFNRVHTRFELMQIRRLYVGEDKSDVGLLTVCGSGNWGRFSLRSSSKIAMRLMGSLLDEKRNNQYDDFVDIFIHLDPEVYERMSLVKHLTGAGELYSA
eukprot:495112_1